MPTPIYEQRWLPRDGICDKPGIHTLQVTAERVDDHRYALSLVFDSTKMTMPLRRGESILGSDTEQPIDVAYRGLGEFHFAQSNALTDMTTSVAPSYAGALHKQLNGGADLTRGGAVMWTKGEESVEGTGFDFKLIPGELPQQATVFESLCMVVAAPVEPPTIALGDEGITSLSGNLEYSMHPDHDHTACSMQAFMHLALTMQQKLQAIYAEVINGVSVDDMQPIVQYY